MEPRKARASVPYSAGTLPSFFFILSNISHTPLSPCQAPLVAPFFALLGASPLCRKKREKNEKGNQNSVGTSPQA